MSVVGIDPGLDGAVALLADDGRLIMLDDIPTVGGGRRVLNAQLLARLLGHKYRLHDEPMCACVERAQSTGPRMKGRNSAFSYGRTVGAIDGVLAALEIPLSYVSPTRWKRAAGIPAGSDKDESRRRAIELFPGAADLLARKKDHGRAEALLIAYYGLTNKGEPSG